MSSVNIVASRAEERGALLIVVLGLVLLLSAVAAAYAAIARRSLAIEAESLPALRSRAAALGESGELALRLASGELAPLVLSGEAAVFSNLTPRIVAVGRSVRRLVSLREGLAGERAPSWSAFRRQLPIVTCAGTAVAQGRGAAARACAPSALVSSALIEGNVETPALRIEPTRSASGDGGLAIAVLGALEIGLLEIPCSATGELVVVASGPVTVGRLMLCAESELKVLIQSAGSTVVVSELITPNPPALLCLAERGEISASLGLQSALGSRISALAPFPAGIAGCAVPRSGPFWTRIKLVGEVF